VRKDSPADKAGIQLGDQIISINKYNQKQLAMSKVIELFYKNSYEKLKTKFTRGNLEYNMSITNIPLVF
jgi:C-terminal processing protease CtpA/Prc